MREPSSQDVEKDDILRKCFSYLSKKGLDGISMRELCNETKMGMGSIYYWFGDKDKLIINVSEWGLNKVADELFECAYDYIDNIKLGFDMFFEIVKKYKQQLGFIYQVAISKKYGSEMKPVANRMCAMYEQYIDIIAEHFHKRKSEFRPCIYLFVSSIIDYVIWSNEEKIQIELECIYDNIMRIIKNEF